MLENLHVKNLALIEEQEVSFSGGLNILTGETGAGKSIIIGSIQLALGSRPDKDMIRNGAEYALIELLFSLNEEQRSKISEMDIPVEEDGMLLLQRKIMAGKSICRVNGETIAVGQLKEISSCLLNMYGQHEHQTLLKPVSYGRMLDQYIGEDVELCKKELKELLKSYAELLQEKEAQDMDDTSRNKEASLLAFELQEIEAAALQEGEDEQLEKQYRILTNARKMQEAIGNAYALTGYGESAGAGSVIGRAVREMKSIQQLDEELDGLTEQLVELDGLLNDFNRSLAEYRNRLEYEEADFVAVEERLNLINHMKSKYGSSIQKILASYEEKQQQLDKLNHYADYLCDLEQRIACQKTQILQVCEKISGLRRKAAHPLEQKLREALVELNFLDVQFAIRIEPDTGHFQGDGYDKVDFLISTNPGEEMRSLWQVASGGELSRIMLAFKTVFADKEDTETLIFDEIDTGISGKTAWKVSEKLGQLAGSHQVLCITHLPQIAAMADEHFLIEKSVKENRTITNIYHLTEEESVRELSRLLGSDEITQATLANAIEMKKTAANVKNSLLTL